METMSWVDHMLDKKEWGPGAWHKEPDKVQWEDAETGLPCLAVRSRMGNWCGYVGVSKGHPAFRRHYDHAVLDSVRVHGGLTYSNFCAETDRLAWERWRAGVKSRAKEAKEYPNGDAAEALRTAGTALENYDDFVALAKGRFICHTVAGGEDDRVWWLGFDCAHSGDVIPQMRAYERMKGWPKLPGSYRETYRTLHYVKKQCSELAKQLVELIK